MNVRNLRDWTNLGYGLLVFALALAFFWLTGPRDVAWLDGADYQRRVATLDVGSGPWDSPLFVLLAQPFQWIPVEPAPRRVALASAAFGAGACLFVYLILKSLLSMAPQFVARRLGLVGALALAVSHTFWLRAVTPGPETLDALLLAATLFGVVRFAEQGRVLSFYCAMLLLGISTANSLLAIFVLPAFALYVRLARPPLVRDIARVRARGLVVLLVGTSVAVAITAWGWATAGFRLAPERLSWITSFQDHLKLDEPSLTPSAILFGASLLYSFTPLSGLFALGGILQLVRQHRAFFWLIFFVFLIQSGLAVVLRIDEPMNAYLTAWIPVAIAVGYGWWKTLSDGGWRDSLIALALTLAPLALYRYTPALLEKLEAETPVLRVVATPFEAPIDPLAHVLNPDRSRTPDARAFAAAELDALPPASRIVALSRAGELTLAPLVYLHTVESRQPSASFERLPTDASELTRFVENRERPVFLSGLHPPRAEVTALLDRFVFLPRGHLFQVVPKNEVPGRNFLDREEVAPFPGEWCGVVRPQGYLVTFSIRETPEGTLSGEAVLNPEAAAARQGPFTRLSFVSGALSATATYRSHFNVHIEGLQAGSRIDGTWYVYQAPEHKGTFVVWKQ